MFSIIGSLETLNWEVDYKYVARVTHQRSDTMYSRTVFPGVRNSVVRLLQVENVALLAVSVYTESEELVRLYHWFMLSKRSLSDITYYRTFSCTDGRPSNLTFASSYQRFNNV